MCFVLALCHSEKTQNLALNTSRIVQMATPPTLGTCIVTPTEGIFMQDMFSVNCSWFYDPTAPLTYMFYMDPDEYTTTVHGEFSRSDDPHSSMRNYANN